MTRFVPWIIPWLVSRFGGDTQVALSPHIPTGETISFVPDHPPADSFAESSVVSVDLSVANRCVDPDGFPRTAVLAGRQGEELTLPGPVISGYKGDRFLINVTNDLTDTSMHTGTTIHWHGIHHHHSVQMDGAAYVTQCPISPQQSFLYNFTGENQVGTFWYHSHYATQYCDGLRGAFIIRDHDDPYKHLYDFDDDSTIITLMDWFHSPSTQYNLPDTTLINGVGCHQPDAEDNNCQPPATHVVKSGKRYRFRLLNMACRPFFDFSIDNHNMTVIEVDGEYVEPYTINAIKIHPGQRISFVLHADQPVGNYWIRSVPDFHWPVKSTASGILRYVNAPEVEPQTNGVTNIWFNETLVRSLEETPARILQPEPDVKLDLVMWQNKKNTLYRINGIAYEPPSIPILLQIMSGVLSPEIDPRGSVYLLPRDKVIEVTFQMNNTLNHPHPFHLHGHHFAVIKSADSQAPNFDRPVMRDTVNTGIGEHADNVTIRFITDNPGPWILHCHDEWHLAGGMSIVFVEDYANIHAEQPLDDATRNLCPYSNPNDNFPTNLLAATTPGSNATSSCASKV